MQLNKFPTVVYSADETRQTQGANSSSSTKFKTFPRKNVIILDNFDQTCVKIQDKILLYFTNILDSRLCTKIQDKSLIFEVNSRLFQD